MVPAETALIEWQQVAAGDGGLTLYRIDAEMDHPSPPGGGRFDPMRTMLSLHPTPTTRHLDAEFAQSAAPVGASSMRVACHVISYPDQLMVVDSSFPSTGIQLFPETLERICEAERRSFAERPLDVLYTHTHFDHAGGRDGVEAMQRDVRILAHPHTRALFEQSNRRDMFFASKAHFFRDCGVDADMETLMSHMRETFIATMGGEVSDEPPRSPFGSASDAPLRVDVEVEPGAGVHPLHDGRVEVHCFEGHIPGHLCVRVGGEHFISGDMWLPATTSTVTPPATARAAGIPDSHTGVKLYMDSSARLLALDVDDCLSYPSHEAIFRNPKRMAMRDLELYHERFALIYGVLEEHTREPMRVLDLAWGGKRGAPVWKLESSLYRLLMAHDEAAAYVHDLVAMGDLEQVDEERFIYTGGSALIRHLEALLDAGRRNYGHLDFRSYRRSS
jgi:glyoxylase-like metal-dependent hydrolase (beta-lactamase superfamily II)